MSKLLRSILVIALGLPGVALVLVGWRADQGSYSQAVLLQVGSAFALLPVLFLIEQRLENLVRDEIEDGIAGTQPPPPPPDIEPATTLAIAEQALATLGFTPEALASEATVPTGWNVEIFHRDNPSGRGIVAIGLGTIARSDIRGLLQGSTGKFDWFVTTGKITRAAVQVLGDPRVIMWTESEPFPELEGVPT